MTTLKAGTARACITPPMGTPMAGFAGRTDGCQGVHDDLTATALVLENDATCLALITLDLIGLDSAQVGQVRSRAAALTGIPEDHVMVCCSHTHSGPSMPSSDPRWHPFGDDVPGETPSRVSVLVETLAGLVAQANEALEPVTLRFPSGRLEAVSQNRRRVAQGGVPVDPEVRAILLARESGEPAAIVVNYACHPTVMGGKNLLISADYPGAMRRTLEGGFPDCRALFVQGACANLNPSWFRFTQNSFDTVEALGGALAGEVARPVYIGLAGTPPESDVALGSSAEVRPLPLRDQGSPEEAQALLDEQRALLRRAEAGEFPANPFPFWHSMTVDENLSPDIARSYVEWAERLVRLAEEGIRVPAPGAEVQALRIGRGGIVGLPGEVFSELGQQIKTAFCGRPVLAAGYTNGSLGYIPTREAFAEGGYEVTVAQRFRTIPVRAGAGEALAEQGASLLSGLYESPLGEL